MSTLYLLIPRFRLFVSALPEQGELATTNTCRASSSTLYDSQSDRVCYGGSYRCVRRRRKRAAYAKAYPALKRKRAGYQASSENRDPGCVRTKKKIRLESSTTADQLSP